MPGEVWWGDARYGEDPWGLPGAGYASDRDPDADTGATPLASTLYEPGDETIVFESEALAEALTLATRAGRPADFLLKLSDHLEDTPGTLFHLYSSEQGDDVDPSRRPTLELAWRASGQSSQRERGIRLVVHRQENA